MENATGITVHARIKAFRFDFAAIVGISEKVLNSHHQNNYRGQGRCDAE